MVDKNIKSRPGSTGTNSGEHEQSPLAREIRAWAELLLDIYAWRHQSKEPPARRRLSTLTVPRPKATINTVQPLTPDESSDDSSGPSP